ncbi:glutamate ABC transporter substrate-binding protein [Streptomyces sulfonofaciens]|nr:glutamate ABC transporter substrate-binding protein [Streptomyces sulfonofaciens]
MAVACVLTAALTLLPLRQAQQHAGGADGTGPGTAQAQRAAAATCSHPEASLRPSPADGPTIDAIKKKKYLVVGIDQSSYRWGYRDPNKIDNSDPEGFDIDLVHEIAEQILGDPDAVQYRAVPTSQRVAAIQRGDVDMVVRTMTITCERAEDVAFSTAYFETGQQIVAPKSSGITGYNATLKGKRVCSADGSTALSELRKKSFGADISIQVPNQLDCLVRLQLGEADAVVTDSALAAGQAAQDPTIEIKGDPFTEEYYGVAMKKGADDLVRRVNHILDDYRRSGWRASYDKWLRDDLGETSGPPAPRYTT